MKVVLNLLFIQLLVCQLSAQSKVIQLVNSSFENLSNSRKQIMGWHGCALGTSADILPGQWNVKTPSSNGETYLGLCTREDGTWESIGQRTSVSLLKEECFNFTIDLAHSKTYVGYNQPIKLRIWGGTDRCNKNQLIYESGFIKHQDWKTYKVNFLAKQDINYIIIEAYYSDKRFSHKGNVLIDNISLIKSCVRA